MFDEELLVRGMLDRARNALAVLRPKNQGAQDQQIQRALEEFEAVIGFSGRHLTCE